MKQNIEGWFYYIEESIKEMKKHLGKENVELFDPCFSTANRVTSICNKLALMSGMKHFFKYVHQGAGCSVSKITLEGTLEDWTKIKNNLIKIGKIDKMLQKYSDRLLPILDKIIETIDTKKIDVKFWSSFVKKKNF